MDFFRLGNEVIVLVLDLLCVYCTLVSDNSSVPCLIQVGTLIF